MLTIPLKEPDDGWVGGKNADEKRCSFLIQLWLML